MSNSLIPFDPSTSSLSTSSSQTSVFDQAASGMSRRLQYLRGQEGKVGLGLKVLTFGGAGLWFVTHLTQIGTFMDSLITLQEQVISAVVLAAVTWIFWLVLSNKTLQHTVAMLIDVSIEKLHKLAIARDKFGAAEFAIRQLNKSADVADEARARVYGVWQKVTTAAQKAYDDANQSFGTAKGFEDEITRRAAGGQRKLKLDDSELQRSFASAKTSLRVNYEFYKRETVQAATLNKRSEILKEVCSATRDKVGEMQLNLSRAKEEWELAAETMKAMQSSDDIVNSREAQDYKTALEGISSETEFYNGRVLMLMDRLDPTVQQYRLGQASDEIADEQFYSQFLSDTKTSVKAEVQQRLLTASEQPVIPEVEQMLGTSASKKSQPVAVSSVRTASSDNFDDLFSHGKGLKK